MNQLKTILLFGVLSALFIGIGAAFAPDQLAVFVVIAAAINLGAYFFSDRIVLAMYRAQEVSEREAPELHAMVRELAAAAGIPVPRVFIIPDRQPNAFATGRNPSHASVAATEGILQALSEPELEGVMAHELAHVKHRDILISSVAATIAAAIMMASRSLMFFGGRSDDDEGSNPIAMLAMIILAPLAAMLIQAAISRSREFSADAGGAAMTGNPHGLASALRKIDAIAHRVPLHANPATAHMFIMKPFSGRGLFSLFSTHPPTEQRVAALVGGQVR